MELKFEEGELEDDEDDFDDEDGDECCEDELE